MKHKRKKQLESRLDELTMNERQKVMKRAARMRKGTGSPRPRRQGSSVPVNAWEDFQDEPEVQRSSGSKQGSLSDFVERILDEEGANLEGPTTSTQEYEETGLVVSVGVAICAVRTHDGEILNCSLSRELAETQRTDLAVGDIVGFERATEMTPARVAEVLPRRSTISRSNPATKGLVMERVLAANVDTVIVVAAIKNPPLSPGLLDRYLIAIERGGAKPVLCINKVDLLANDSEREAAIQPLLPYSELGIPIFHCSAEQGVGVESLRAHVAGKTCVLVGHSGVGKSSMLNAIAPQLDQTVGHVNLATGKGRHTTTTSHLFELPDGTRIIDTPGIREFGLWKLSADELRWYFHDFDAPANDCRFSDCSHRHEPHCGVKAAVEAGEVHERRYATYLRLHEDLAP